MNISLLILIPMVRLFRAFVILYKELITGGIFLSLLLIGSNAVALESRTICGETVSSATYSGAIPSWLDGNAVIYDSSQTVPLGVLSSNAFATNSILNSYGSYGSSYSASSIFNSYGTYGSTYSSYSVCNSYASTYSVPQIWRNGVFIGYLTRNQYISGAIDPVTLVAALLKQGFGGSVVYDLLAPSTPTGFVGVASSSTQINFSWNASSDNVGVVAYILYSGNSLSNILAASPTGLTLSGLSPSTTYTFSLAACDAANNCSNRSSPILVTTLATAAATTTSTTTTTTTSTTTTTTTTSAPTTTTTTTAAPTTTTSTSTTTTTTTTVPTTTTTSTSTTSTTAASSTTTTSTTTTTLVNKVDLVSGWNLIGNGYSGTMDVGSVFGDKTLVISVWKWLADKALWAFYAPSMSSAQLESYALNKKYEVLSTINAGEGFWVNAAAPWSLTIDISGKAALESSNYASSGVKALPQGWSLIATGDSPTPSLFNSKLSTTPPSAGVIPSNFISLWAWDPSMPAWRFYAPSLHSNGTLDTYIQSKQYQSFGSKPLTPTTGFWVNKP